MPKSQSVTFGEPDNPTSYRLKTNYLPTPAAKNSSMYFPDPFIVDRVRKYLEDRKDKYYIDFYDMVQTLQLKYKEYGRKKRSSFKLMVERAFAAVLESYNAKEEIQISDDSSTDISDVDLEDAAENEPSNVANKQMTNLYSKGDPRNTTPVSKEKKVINISSDKDDDEGIREAQRAKRFKQNDNGDDGATDLTDTSQKPETVTINNDVTVTVCPSPVKRNGNNENVAVNNSQQLELQAEPVSKSEQRNMSQSATHASQAAPSKATSTATAAATSKATPAALSASRAATASSARPAAPSATTPAATPAATPATSRSNLSSRKRPRNHQGQTENATKDLPGQQTKQSDLPVRTPNYTFQDIGGCTKVLQEVCKLLIHIKHPEIYAQVGVSPPRGFLLHGPPGCGKTLLAGAIAGELKIPLLKVSGPELIAGVSGESEERIRSLFEQAVSIAPCVLFLDEVDAISPNRSTAQREMERRIVAQLLSCLDDLGEKENGNRVLVVGATNRPDSLDPALRRAGRFDREVCLGIPDRAARSHILKVVCKNLSLDPEVASDEGMDYLASLTPGFVGADLKALTREAAMVAINRIFNTIQKNEAEEVEMLDETEKPAENEQVPEEKTMDVEIAVEEECLEDEVPDGAVKSVVIEVKEMKDDEVVNEEVESIVIDETEITVVEPVVEPAVEAEVEPDDAVTIEGPSINGEAETREEEANISTEVVDLELSEVSDGQIGDDPRMTITIVTPDGGSQLIAPGRLSVDTDAIDVTVEPGPPYVTVMLTDDGKIVPPAASVAPVLAAPVEPEAADVPEVVVEQVNSQIEPPEILISEVVQPEGVLPEGVVIDVPPQVPPEAAESAAPPPEVAKQTDDVQMVVEEVAGMSLTQQAGPDCSTNLMMELDELRSWLQNSPPLSADQLNGLNVNLNDFREALRHVQPSAKREGFATVPDVTWNDVGSLASVRAELQLAILAPVRYPDQFEQLGISSPTGVLLCGPPGCGKTLLAKAIANEAGVNFISVKGPELLNMYVGESERAVRQVFQRAKSSAPCVIFFDELDSLCPRRSDNSEGNVTSRVVNQLLTEMDGVEGRSSVFLMAATNRPDILDPAVLRPGRLDKVLYVGLPNAADRYDILRALTKNGTKPVLDSNVDLAQIAQHPACEGYSGADLAALVREAGVQSLREFVTSPPEKQACTQLAVGSTHFAAAIAKIRPSVTEKDQKHYELLRRTYAAPRRPEDTMDTT